MTVLIFMSSVSIVTMMTSVTVIMVVGPVTL